MLLNSAPCGTSAFKAASSGGASAAFAVAAANRANGKRRPRLVQRSGSKAIAYIVCCVLLFGMLLVMCYDFLVTSLGPLVRYVSLALLSSFRL